MLYEEVMELLSPVEEVDLAVIVDGNVGERSRDYFYLEKAASAKVESLREELRRTILEALFPNVNQE